MEAVSGYVKAIAFFMIFMAFIEIITPSGSFKKYIRLISSLILIALLLEPIGSLLKSVSLEGNYYQFQNMVDNKLMSVEREEYEKSNAEIVLREYKKNLKEQAKQVAESQTGFIIREAEFIVNADYQSEDFAEILGIHITALVSSGGGEPGAVRKALLGNANGGGEGGEFKEIASVSIKKCLSDFYNVPEGNIHITVQEEQP